MVSDYQAAKPRATWLMQRLGIATTNYQNPQVSDHPRDESGADVITIIDGRRIGIQVTDLDTGDTPGVARAAETKLARDAEAQGRTYGTWAQNDHKVGAIARTIERKGRMSFSGFDEFWLLICCGIPKMGAIASTLAITPWIDPSELDAHTQQTLAASRYTRAFIYAIARARGEGTLRVAA
jgi:hypothetical protein